MHQISSLRSPLLEISTLIWPLWRGHAGRGMKAWRPTENGPFKERHQEAWKLKRKYWNKTNPVTSSVSSFSTVSAIPPCLKTRMEFSTQKHEKKKNIYWEWRCLGCVTYHFEQWPIADSSALPSQLYTEMEYGTRPLTVILKSFGMVLAITVVSVLKVRRTIGRENFLIPLRNR